MSRKFWPKKWSAAPLIVPVEEEGMVIFCRCFSTLPNKLQGRIKRPAHLPLVYA
jgi:hypothetical protein